MGIALEDALERMPLSAEITGADGLIRYVNAAFERMTGYSREEAVGKSPASLLRTNDADPSAYEEIWDRLMRGEAWSGPLVSRRKDGALLHLEVTVSPIVGADGAVEALYAIRRDVTPRVIAERAAQETQDLYRQIFQNNRAIKLIVDPSTGAIEDANEAAALFYGYGVQTLRTMSIGQINALPQVEVNAELALAASESRTYFRFPHRLASGEIRRVEVFSGPVSFGERKLLFSIVHDVTDRERAEADLVRSEARFRALLRQLPIGVVVHREGNIVYSNEAHAEMLGHTTDDLIGKPVLSFLDATFHAAVRERIRAASVELASTATLRTRMLKRDGTTIDVEVRGLPIDFDGEPAIMALIVDVSDRDRLEAQLRGAQRMEAVGRLAGGIAHDFNNLLFVILNVARFLTRRIPEGDAMRADVEQIENAGRRAADLTRQLLLFARGADTVAAPVELNLVVADIARLLRGTLGEQVELLVSLGDAPTYVKIARPNLEQVLVNLAVNARDAMPSGGILRISTTRVDGGADQAPGSAGPVVRLVVSDTGIGMSKEVADHAFEPFFSTKEQGRGTGLGLSITYGIVQKAGGSITLDSTLGQGTTFTILLPLAEPTAPTAPPASPRPSEGEGETILVVEDEDAVRSTVERVLREHGYEVVCAAGASDALRMVAEMPRLDLVLTDVIMPRTSGPELVTRLRETRPDQLVLYMSGYTGDALAERGVSEAEVLNKPCDEAELLSRVRRALSRR